MEETLGKRIATNRKRLSLTQDKLADLLGVTAQAVSKWENDQSCPDISMLPKLAEIFAITTDELLGIVRKEVPIEEVSSGQPENTATEVPSEKTEKWKALSSPGAAFGFWLFLTGIVALIDALRLPPYDLADISLHHIAICCGIFAFGLTGLLRRFSLLRLGCAMAGGVFIFNLLSETGIADMDWRVPLLAGIALLGLDLLIDTLRKPKHALPKGHWVDGTSKNYCTYDGEHFDCVTCFGSGNRRIQLSRLSGGSGEVTFGELILDLSQCTQITDGCEITLKCAFGSLEVLVPASCRVQAATSTAFGTVETKGSSNPDAEVTVQLNCTARFGEISIRYI